VTQRRVALREAKSLAWLAWPLIIGNLGNVAIQVTDTMMIGRVGPTYLAAVGLAAHLSLVISLFCTGTVEAVTPLVAQARGRDAGNKAALVSVVRHGMLLGVLMCLPLCALLWDSAWAFRASGQAEVVAQIGSNYLRYFLFAIPAMVVATALRGFVVGMEHSRLVLYVSIATLVVNFIGNWILIFGNLGAPAMGATGAAISSVIAASFSVVLFVVLIRVSPPLQTIGLFSQAWQMRLAELFQIAKLGIPIGLILLVEIAFFTSAAILVGRFGVDQLAGHQIAVQTVALTLMFPLAIGQAATVRVALFAGKNDRNGAKIASLVPLWVSAAIMVSLGCGLWIAAPQIAGLFLGGNAGTEHTATLAYAVSFLRVAAVFQIADGLQATAAGALRGFRDTVVPLFLASGSYWLVGIPMAYFLSEVRSLEGWGVWVGMAMALVICAVSMVTRIVWTLSRRWRATDTFTPPGA
jgi:MATE family multidrug resistance protein